MKKHIYDLQLPPIAGKMNWKKRKTALVALSTLLLVFSVAISSTSTSEAIEEDAFFEVEIKEYEESVVDGDEVIIEYTVTNTGETEDTQNIIGAINGNVVHTLYDLTLEGEETYEGEFTWTASYSEFREETVVEVMSDNETDSVTITVFEEEPEPLFEVDITDYEEEIEEGETVNVEYIIENTGEIEGTQDIIFNVEGAQEEIEEDVKLEADDDYSGEFTWEAEDEGDYDLEVTSDDDTESVTVSVIEEDDEDDDDTPGFTTIFLLLGTVIAAGIYYKKQQ